MDPGTSHRSRLGASEHIPPILSDLARTACPALSKTYARGPCLARVCVYNTQAVSSFIRRIPDPLGPNQVARSSLVARLLAMATVWWQGGPTRAA